MVGEHTTFYPHYNDAGHTLLREVDNYTDKKGGTELSDIIHEKFDALKEFQWKNPPPSTEERIQQKKSYGI